MHEIYVFWAFWSFPLGCVIWLCSLKNHNIFCTILKNPANYKDREWESAGAQNFATWCFCKMKRWNRSNFSTEYEISMKNEQFWKTVTCWSFLHGWGWGWPGFALNLWEGWEGCPIFVEGACLGNDDLEQSRAVISNHQSAEPVPARVLVSIFFIPFKAVTLLWWSGLRVLMS